MRFVAMLFIATGIAIIYLLAWLGMSPTAALADVKTTWGL